MMVDDGVNPMLNSYQGPSPALQIAFDIVKRGVVIAPVLVLIGALIWGTAGAASVALALGLVLLNVMLSAYIIAWGAKISFAALAGAAMFGFLLRLSLITAVVIALKDQTWVDLVALGITIIVTHLGLLFWETRYISGSLAYPGLKPGTKLIRRSDKESVAS
jgi:hypothetical protein